MHKSKRTGRYLRSNVHTKTILRNGEIYPIVWHCVKKPSPLPRVPGSSVKATKRKFRERIVHVPVAWHLEKSCTILRMSTERRRSRKPAETETAKPASSPWDFIGLPCLTDEFSLLLVEYSVEPGSCRFRRNCWNCSRCDFLCCAGCKIVFE